ncbi:hypothetical protein GpartN1_g2779.t1 [Galdieria partita]|uniref:Heterogeneous nuclear ribonucleoprotein Q acidic domain-containing protein n=1 Tax=Galdieria partita TaxID=83374 RepID=A0A9C7UPL3_9RHOD|nr:hypothetical protein GpartN1_g2779.t1 [Galdieria partita]
MNNHFAYRSSIFKLPEKFLPPTKRRKVQLYKASLLEPLSENGIVQTNNTSVDTSSAGNLKDEPLLNHFRSYGDLSVSSAQFQEKTESKQLSVEVSSRESEVSAPLSSHTTSLQGSSQDKTEDNSIGKLYMDDNQRQPSPPYDKSISKDPLKDKAVESDTSSGEIPLGKLETMEVANHNLVELNEEVRFQLQSLFQAGVVFPEDFDERAFQFLAWLPVRRAIAALTDLSERNFSNVKKRKAFVMSVLRQYSPDDTRWSSPQKLTHETKAPIVVPPSALAHLPPRVADSLQQVFASGVCHPSKFDDLAMEVLVSLDESDAVQALNEFANVDPSTVRNPSAFWMGIARRYQIRAKKASIHSYSSAHFQGNENMIGPHSRKKARSGGVDWHKQQTEHNSGLPGKASQSVCFSSHDRFETNRRRTHHEDSKMVIDYIEELTRRNILAPGALDEKVVDTLKRIPQDDALAVLRDLEHLDQRRIRNISAFVTGLIRKVTNSDHLNQRLTTKTSPTNLVDELEPRVKQRYLSLFPNSLGNENNEGLDDRALEALSNLRPELSLQVLDELSKVDVDHSRNISMIAMGIMRKVTQRDNHERNVRSFKY